MFVYILSDCVALAVLNRRLMISIWIQIFYLNNSYLSVQDCSFTKILFTFIKY